MRLKRLARTVILLGWRTKADSGNPRNTSIQPRVFCFEHPAIPCDQFEVFSLPKPGIDRKRIAWRQRTGCAGLRPSSPTLRKPVSKLTELLCTRGLASYTFRGPRLGIQEYFGENPNPLNKSGITRAMVGALSWSRKRRNVTRIGDSLIPGQMSYFVINRLETIILADMRFSDFLVFDFLIY